MKMATETLAPAPPQVRRPLYRAVNRTAERVFFGGMALLLCVVVVIGFTPTYFGAGVFRAPLPSPILQVHGAVFTLWMILYLAQTALISAGRVGWHRTFGTVAFCLPPIMVVLGLFAALDALHRKVMIGPLDPSVSFAIPTLGILSFAIVIYAAWRTRRRPDAHKRLILLATVGLTEAALGRFPWTHMGISPAGGAVEGLGVLILLVVIYDLLALHRVHRSTMWAAPVIFVLNAFAVPIGMTAEWHAFAALLSRTVAVHL
jgi:hypothetical protein